MVCRQQTELAGYAVRVVMNAVRHQRLRTTRPVTLGEGSRETFPRGVGPKYRPYSIRKRSGIGAADHEPEEEASRGCPDDGEVVPDSVDRWRARYAEDGGGGKASDDAHEQCSEEVVGPGEEAAEQPGDPADATDDRYYLEFHGLEAIPNDAGCTPILKQR